MLVINKIFVDADNPRQNNRKKYRNQKLKKKKKKIGQKHKAMITASV